MLKFSIFFILLCPSMRIDYMFYFFTINSVWHTQQRESRNLVLIDSVPIKLHSQSSLSAEFWSYFVLSVRTQLHAYPRYQNKEMQIFTFHFLKEIDPQRVSDTVARLCPCVTTDLKILYSVHYIIFIYRQQLMPSWLSGCRSVCSVELPELEMRVVLTLPTLQYLGIGFFMYINKDIENN